MDVNVPPAGGGLGRRQRVTQPEQGLPELAECGHRRIEQVLDLVTEARGVRPGPAGFAIGRPGPGLIEDGRQDAGLARDDAAQGIEDDEQALAAGIDHAGISQHRELQRRSVERGQRAVAGAACDFGKRGADRKAARGTGDGPRDR